MWKRILPSLSEFTEFTLITKTLAKNLHVAIPKTGIVND